MIDDLFDEFGTNPMFIKMVSKMTDRMIIDVNNELKFGDVKVDYDIVGAVILLLFRNQLGFEFIKTINLNLNGNDEVAFANVTDFINKLELLYVTADENKEKAMKKYGE